MILLYRYNSYIYKNYNGRGVSKIMSSLQKFHRRTQPFGPVVLTIGSGSDDKGYWLGGLPNNKIIIAPLSTEAGLLWGSNGTLRGTTSTSDGLSNTNTLYAFGNSITTGHPAAYYCKTLTTGGYNTWYLPAKDELLTCYSNKSATPFATANNFTAYPYWTSTEMSSQSAWAWYMPSIGSSGSSTKTNNFSVTGGGYNVRAIRKSSI